MWVMFGCQCLGKSPVRFAFDRVNDWIFLRLPRMTKTPDALTGVFETVSSVKLVRRERNPDEMRRRELTEANEVRAVDAGGRKCVGRARDGQSWKERVLRVKRRSLRAADERVDAAVSEQLERRRAMRWRKGESESQRVALWKEGWMQGWWAVGIRSSDSSAASCFGSRGVDGAGVDGAGALGWGAVALDGAARGGWSERAGGLWVEETGEGVGETMWGAGVTAAAEAAETRKKRERRVAGDGGGMVAVAGGLGEGEVKEC